MNTLSYISIFGKEGNYSRLFDGKERKKNERGWIKDLKLKSKYYFSILYKVRTNEVFYHRNNFLRKCSL